MSDTHNMLDINSLFRPTNQACQQLTDEVDKEYKKMCDNIKEGSEKVKVQIF
jgi:hypothetical protein